MNNQNNFLYTLLNGDLRGVEISGPAINPFNQRDTNITTNKNPTFPDNPSIKNYSWSLQEINFDYGIEYPLVRKEIFNASIFNIASSVIQSDNGNLSVFNVPPKTVQVYSASLYSTNSVLTSLNINWDDSLALYFNDSLFASNFINSGYNSKYVDIPISTGLNKIDIYLYSNSGNKNFTINNSLGSLAQGWYIPNHILPDTPTNLLVENDFNSNNKKDPNINIVSWNNSEELDDKTLGYKVFRRGPYLSGVSPIVSSSYSGYNESTLTGYNQFSNKDIFYTISKVSPNGESLPLLEFRAIPSGAITPVLITGIWNSAGVGLLSGTEWEYCMFPRTSGGDHIWTPPVSINSLGGVINLDYIVGANYSHIDVYRIANTGVSGIRRNVELDSFTSYLIATITGIGNGSFTDSGIAQSTFITGIKFLSERQDPYDINRFYNYNTFAISWSGSLESGAYYRVYKTNYSGIYGDSSLVGETNLNRIIDSGVLFQGAPVSFKNIGIVENTKRFTDVVLSNRTYDYKVSSYNYSYLESPLSTGYTITAGDPYAPNTPSGISITSLNGFATLGWQNGVEPDLEGTIVYQSDNGVSYSEVGRTTSNNYTRFIGYSGSPWFKLANYDTSDNISPLSAGYQGSGTLVADNIILRDFRTLSTLDIDLDNYIYSGFNLSTSVMVRSQMCAIHCPSGVYESYSSAAPPILTLGLERYSSVGTQYTTFSPDGALGGTVAIPYNSGFGIAAIEDTSQSRYHLLNVAYYTGVNSDLYLFNRCFEGVGGVPSIAYTFLNGNTTGIRVGDWITSQFPTSQKEFTNAALNPVIATNSGFSDKHVIIYLSGTGANHSVSFGFTSSNKSGIYTGPEKYLSIHNADISKRDGFSAAMDYDGYIHLFYMGSGNNPRTNKLKWYKLDYQVGNNNPVTILASGAHSNNGVGGYLFEQSTNKYVLGEPRCFIDELNNIYIMQKGNRAETVVATPFKKTIFTSQITKNGSVLVSPNSIYQIPFEFESTWGIAYTPITNLAYSWYTLGETAREGNVGRYNVKNETYNYRDGLYRRLHSLEFYNNASLYQILQSILK